MRRKIVRDDFGLDTNSSHNYTYLCEIQLILTRCDSAFSLITVGYSFDSSGGLGYQNVEHNCTINNEFSYSVHSRA